MSVIRGKFQVESIKHFSSDNTWSEAVLTAVFGGSPEENTYAKATPSGTITMTITNPSAIEHLQPGQKFYVDFTPVS
jgi:hypothetical protein